MTDRSTTSAILRISAAGACVGAIYSAPVHSEAGTRLVIGAVNAPLPLRGKSAPLELVALAMEEAHAPERRLVQA